MASISLPPISTLHRDHDPSIAHQMSQDGGPPPSRTLPFPYCPPVQAIPQPEYVQSVRPPYSSIQTPYAMPMARMPLPSSSDAANLMYNASRHSAKPKEVKRRTKTGCLTCRKRRIKCGEEKPQCRNCLKSKRDCAGYDHLQTPSSQSIQPAPTSAPAISNTASRSSYTVDPPTSPATSSHYNSATTGSPRDQQDYTYNPRSADLQLPNINQGYGGTSYPPQRYP